MNAPDRQIRAAITRRAADWFAAHRAGPLVEKERAEFFAWLKASPIHVEEYLGVAALERALHLATRDSTMSVRALVELAREDRGGIVEAIAPPAAGPFPLPARSRRPLWLSLAAVVTASVAGFAVFWSLRDAPALGLTKTYETAHGVQGVWRLPDGSTLHLNTDSAVTVRFSSAERLLEVDHGQVLVEVAHEDRRVFRAHSGTTNTVAVGTEFEVYRRSDSTVITVVTGQVVVMTGDPPPPQNLAAALGGLHVGAGQQVRVTAGILPSAATAADVRDATAWLERKIAFEQRPLGEVIEEFNRYNAIPFIIRDPSLRLLPISGVFDAFDTESFAAFIASLDGVRLQRLPLAIEVSRSRRRPDAKDGAL